MLDRGLGQRRMLSRMTGNSAELSIGQVGALTGLSVHALRLYEREGLLISRVRRRTNGHRVYSQSDVEWLSYCTKFRASGMPLAAIRRYAELIQHGPGSEDERLALLRDHRQRINAHIAELTACLKLITAKIEIYEEHLSRGSARHLWTTLPTGASQRP